MTRDRVPAAEITMGGATRSLDLDDPELPAWVTDALPARRKLRRAAYEAALHALQVELVKLQAHQQASGQRIVCLFEGRDAAGKGGTIKRAREHISPRAARIVALAKPTERERGEWYFQRYVAHLPTDGELVLFDRSWYNRAGVERVMGFADEDQVRSFLEEAPDFERALVRSGIILVKFWLTISQATQIARFHRRRHDPLRTWKLSPMDIEALGRWDDYTRARDAMFAATHTDCAPWTVIEADEKRRARLAAIRVLLSRVDYEGKDEAAIGRLDEAVAHPPD